jgi:hypothetical protein
MRKVKQFINKNKEVFIGITCVIIGGVLGHIITKNKQQDDTKISNREYVDIDLLDFPIVDTLDEAVDQFKEYQETNKSVAMFWENNKYAVMDLDQK